MEWLFAVVAEKRSEISPDGLLALVTAVFDVFGGGDGANACVLQGILGHAEGEWIGVGVGAGAGALGLC